MSTQTIDLTPGVDEQVTLLRYFAYTFVEKGFVDWSYGPMASLLDLARCVYVNAGPERFDEIIKELERKQALVDERETR